MCLVTLRIIILVGDEVCQVILTRPLVVCKRGLMCVQGVGAGLGTGVEGKVF